MKNELKQYLLTVLLVFVMFALLMGVVFLMTYIPELREGFTAFQGKQVAKWEYIKGI
ncbi:MAG: hypothetical protein IJZ73_03210 [Clostridia bacterium]|nr:hypothetical protein [Clostridia bacterium]